MIAITVFTATYNRARRRAGPRPREPPPADARREPLRVDRRRRRVEGRDRGACVRGWHAEERPSPIRYFWQENRGKHVAWNRAVRRARELFVVLDSDDACTTAGARRPFPHPLERAHTRAKDRARRHPRPMPNARRRSHRARLPALRHRRLRGSSPFSTVSTPETWNAARTDVLKAHPFPGAARSRSSPRASCGSRSGETSPVAFARRVPPGFYFSGEHGTGDQLSRLSSWRYPAGVALMQRTLLDHVWRLRRRVPPRARAGGGALRSLLAPRGRGDGREEIGTLEHRGARALCWGMLPAGCTMYVVDRLRHRGDRAAHERPRRLRESPRPSTPAPVCAWRRPLPIRSCADFSAFGIATSASVFIRRRCRCPCRIDPDCRRFDHEFFHKAISGRATPSATSARTSGR